MKKTFRIAALALLASFALALVGCSNSSGGGAPFVAVGGTGSGGGNETAGGQSGGGTESGGGQNGGQNQQNTTETKWTISGTEYTVKDGKVTVTQNGTKTEVGTVDSSGVVTITQGGQTITVRAQGAGSSNVTVTIATTTTDSNGASTTTTKTYSGDIASGTLTNTEDANDTITIAKVETTTGGNGGGNANPSGPSFTVTFNTDGGSSVTSQPVASGGVATRPAAPTKTDCAFVCWFKDGALYDFASPVNGDIELTAKWYAFQTSVKELPSTTSGSYGTNATYVLFGDFPQTHKADSVVIDQSQKITMGGLEYYPGSDGNLYAMREQARFWRYYYSDGTLVPSSGSPDYKIPGYFKVEPIKWRVLKEDYGNDHKKLLVAENSLTTDYFHRGGSANCDNWEYSDLRNYLNGTTGDFLNKGFLQSAFTASAQNLIATTTLDNKIYDSDGTEASSEMFDNLASRRVNDTQDKVFILSIKETAYYVNNGIDVEYQHGAPSDRLRTHTDYSLAQANKYGSVYAVDDTYNYGENPDDYAMINGVAYIVWKNNMAFYQKYGNAAAYWLRTPARSSSSCQDVGWSGEAGGSSMQTNINQLGVVPALCLE